jgi:hypothetical protein
LEQPKSSKIKKESWHQFRYSIYTIPKIRLLKIELVSLLRTHDTPYETGAVELVLFVLIYELQLLHNV